jgi:hypothetical protein
MVVVACHRRSSSCDLTVSPAFHSAALGRRTPTSTYNLPDTPHGEIGVRVQLPRPEAMQEDKALNSRRIHVEPAAWRRAGSAIRRGVVRRLGFVSDQRFYLDSCMVAPRTDVERIGTYSAAVDVRFELPANGWLTTHSYPPRFVYRLAGATVDPISNLVYGHNGNFVAESASDLPLRRLYDWPRPRLRPPDDVLRGEFVFLPSNPNMYHWMEDLAVFLHSALTAPQATILVAARAARHGESWNRRRQEILRRFDDRQIKIIDRPTRVESLVLTGKTGGLGSPSGLQVLHPNDIITVRGHFSDWLSEEASGHCYYLSRRGYSRSPIDEPELESIAQGQGFRVLQAAQLTLEEQARLFSSARAVVGLHGAALSNTIWLPAGASVVEFFSSAYMPFMFAGLASMRSLDYRHDRYELGSRNRMGKEFLERARSHMAGIAT